VVALTWFVVSSLWVFPHNLSYFNELVGGPRRGHYFLVDASIDWGQDISYLSEWGQQHPEAQPLYLDCFCNVDPASYGIEFEQAATSNRTEDGLLVGSGGLKVGWYAISAHRLHERDNANRLFLEDFEPVEMIGYSIYIYHLSDEDIRRRLDDR
jgi:hypothetical protein